MQTFGLETWGEMEKETWWNGRDADTSESFYQSLYQQTEMNKYIVEDTNHKIWNEQAHWNDENG